MLIQDNIKIEVNCQGFEAKSLSYSPDGDKSVIIFNSIVRNTAHCLECGGAVHIYDQQQVNLKDMPLWKGIDLTLCFIGHRYRCVKCGKTYADKIPLKCPGTRITYRAAEWIKSFLKNKISVRAIQEITGIHWETIRNIQKGFMDDALARRQQELKEAGSKPKMLAVDEFAIHKGHSYATCVMDLETGEVLWVGEGRSMADFEKFFEETDPSFLSAVMAVAMDMNASYNRLVEKYLPHAEIVYDRYHMQAQYGKDVLGVVRLEEAHKHTSVAKEIKERSEHPDNKETRLSLKVQAKSEMAQYRSLKKLRWTLLMNGANLSDNRTKQLNSILAEHAELAVCYAMKEEMIKLFSLVSADEALTGWTKWFKAAKESGISALVHFAELKEKRIRGLVAHAFFPISTGKLEGFNNKIKVAKRIAYGYRNEDYFFSLIRFLSLPSVRSSPEIP